MSAPPSDRPRKFDTNLVVVGAGSAGLVSAYIAASAKARVTLIEREKMGGDCLNTGCVPSKALIKSAAVAAGMRRGAEFGVHAGDVRVDFPRVMERVREVIRRIEPHDSVERYTNLGVDCVQGEATITSPWSVAVNGRTLTARSIIIASGGRPAVPPIPGLDEVRPLTSENVWELESLPSRLLVLGGGPIGCELAQSFARLGSQVTLVEMLPRLLTKEDQDAADLVHASLKADGVNIMTGYKASGFSVAAGQKQVTCEGEGETLQLTFDEVLVAVGRRANTQDLGLEQVGVALNKNGTVSVNQYLQSSCPSIYACGDVAGPYQLTHAAAHQAWYCAMNALFGGIKKFKVDYSVIPWTTFTDPEVARVGMSEDEARAANRPVEITRYGIDDLDRAITDGEDHGFVKVLTSPGSDRVVGATIVGHHAGDLLTEYVTAMRHGLGMRKLLSTIHSYPTLAEANKFAAGEWQKQRLPERLLGLARRFHAWRLG